MMNILLKSRSFKNVCKFVLSRPKVKPTLRNLVHSATILSPEARCRLRGMIESVGTEEILSISGEGGLPIYYPSRSTIGVRAAECGQWTATAFSLLFDLFLADANSIIEVGANIGLDTLFMASRVKSHCQIIAFEPVEKYRLVLEKNIRMNGAKNVHIFESSVSSTSGAKVELHVTSSSASVVESTSPSFPTIMKQVSETITLDDFMKDNDIVRSVDLLKIDTDGWDQDVVEGGLNTIKRYLPFLYVEFSGYNLKVAGKSNESFAKLLGRLGYEDFFLITKKEGSGKRIRGYENLTPNLDERSSSDVFAFSPKRNGER